MKKNTNKKIILNKWVRDLDLDPDLGPRLRNMTPKTN